MKQLYRSFFTWVFFFISLPAFSQVSETLGCILEPSKKIAISSAVPGVIAYLPVERGMKVKKGQLLFELQSAVHKAAVDLASAKAEFAERKRQRNAELFDDDILSANERDEIDTENLLAKLELNQAQAELSLRKVKSPASGVVIEKYNNEGEYVGPEPVLELAVLHPLNVEVLMSVEKFGSLAVGDSIEVSLNQPVAAVHTAKVAIIDPIIDSASGTFRVRLELPNKDYSIPAGVMCKLSL